MAGRSYFLFRFSLLETKKGISLSIFDSPLLFYSSFSVIFLLQSGNWRLFEQTKRLGSDGVWLRWVLIYLGRCIELDRSHFAIGLVEPLS